jgi:hypothetical protein
MSHTTSPTPPLSSSSHKTPPSDSQHAHSVPSSHPIPSYSTSQSHSPPDWLVPAPSPHPQHPNSPPYEQEETRSRGLLPEITYCLLYLHLFSWSLDLYRHRHRLRQSTSFPRPPQCTRVNNYLVSFTAVGEPHPATNNLRTQAPLNHSSKSVPTNAEFTDFVITISLGSGVA